MMDGGETRAAGRKGRGGRGEILRRYRAKNGPVASTCSELSDRARRVRHSRGTRRGGEGERFDPRRNLGGEDGAAAAVGARDGAEEMGLRGALGSALVEMTSARRI
jgi:hypothetical protein